MSAWLRRPGSRRVALGVLVVVVGVGATSWLRARPRPVERAVVDLGDVATEVMGTGTLEARVSAVISPRVGGLITRVLVDQGERVRQGQLLATLFDGDLVEQVRINQAEVGVARAAVDQAAAQRLAAAAAAQEARASHARASQLVTNSLVSRDEFDKALRQRDVSDADLQRARVSEVAAARQVDKAHAAARFARERLADTHLAAPFDGLVVKRVRDPGNVAVPGDAILQLVATETMWVSTWIDETAMATLRIGQPARVVFRSEPGVSYSGSVARIGQQVDPETREFVVDVRVPRLPRNWAIGQRAEVFVETGRRSGVVAVPAAAVTAQDGQPGVFVATGGRSRWRAVELGLRGSRSVEIRRGVVPGETVVWTPAGGGTLVDGRRVRAR